MASSKIKGITIEIDGNTSKLNDALRGTEQELNKTEKELKNVNNALKFDPQNTELLAQKQRLLGDAIKDTTSKLNTLKEAKKQAEAQGLTNESEDYRELEREISRTTQSLKGLQTQQEGVNNALQDGGKSGIEFGDILKANIVSDLVIGGIKSLGGAIKEVSKAMLDAVKDTANYADEVNTLAKQYNLSTKEIQQYQKASQLIDVEFTTIAKSMSKLTKNMKDPSKSVSSAFKELGISVRDTKGELRDSNEVFNEVISKLGEVSNETEQDALALEIFGKSSAELGSLINGGVEQLAEFNKYLEENNLLLSQDELDALNSVQDGFDKLDVTFESTKQKIMAELAPVITPLLDDISQFIIDHKDDIITLVKEVVEWLTGEEGKQMFQEIKDMVKNVADFLLDLPQLREELELITLPLKIIGEIIGGIVDAFKWIKENMSIVNEMQQYQIDNGTFGYNMGSFGGLMHSGGFGALQSGGYGNITLNASFVANGNLDESQAKRFASLMVAQINEELGNQL